MIIQYKYSLIASAVFILFGYLVVTQVVPRWQEVAGRWSEVKDMAEEALSPEQMNEKKLRLIEEKKTLVSQAKTYRKARYELTQAGMFESFSQAAKECKVHLVSVTPLEASPAAVAAHTVSF